MEELFADVNIWRETCLARVAKRTQARSDAELAKALQVSPSAISTWRKRSTMPFEALAKFAIANSVSLDWVFGLSAANATAIVAAAPSAPGATRSPYEVFGERYRAAEALVSEVLSATGFTPGPVLREALRTVAFTTRVDGEHLLMLVAGVGEMLKKNGEEKK